VLSIVRSAGITARERFLEVAKLGYDVPGEIVEVIDLCEIRRFYQGESADSRVLAYALTSAGRRELMTGGPDPWLIFADHDRTLRNMKVLRNDMHFLIPDGGKLARMFDREARGIRSGGCDSRDRRGGTGRGAE
jgi:hypothetical protein